MKKIFTYFAIVCLVLVTFVSCGGKKYFGTYALTDLSMDSLARADLMTYGYKEGTAEFEKALSQWKEKAESTPVFEIYENASNPSFTLNKDGQAHFSIDGEEGDLPYIVDKDRKLYVNNQLMGQFTEDYKCLVLTAIFDLELYKIDK